MWNPIKKITSILAGKKPITVNNRTNKLCYAQPYKKPIKNKKPNGLDLQNGVVKGILKLLVILAV